MNLHSGIPALPGPAVKQLEVLPFDKGIGVLKTQRKLPGISGDERIVYGKNSNQYSILGERTPEFLRPATNCKKCVV
jgi:hypothetical protein